jgi:hypothetical protein
MRNFIFMLVAHLSLATQVASPLAGLAAVSVSAHAQAEVQTNIQNQIVFDTNSPQLVVAQLPAQPNFDTEVLAPLRAKQEAKAKAAARVRVIHRVVLASATPTADSLLRLRLCESGGTYNRNSGNGYYGAYQYAISSWGGYGGYARADLAPAEVQDAKVMADIATRGWYPWPACARKIGML